MILSRLKGTMPAFSNPAVMCERVVDFSHDVRVSAATCCVFTTPVPSC